MFPNKTLGNQLDVLARHALWNFGLDYNTGTGHGVGSFLNVHEGPHGISKRRAYTEPFQHGMFVTDGMLLLLKLVNEIFNSKLRTWIL